MQSRRGSWRGLCGRIRAFWTFGHGLGERTVVCLGCFVGVWGLSSWVPRWRFGDEEVGSRYVSFQRNLVMFEGCMQQVRVSFHRARGPIAFGTNARESSLYPKDKNIYYWGKNISNLRFTNSYSQEVS